jgi:hypothetical protein
MMLPMLGIPMKIHLCWRLETVVITNLIFEILSCVLPASLVFLCKFIPPFSALILRLVHPTVPGLLTKNGTLGTLIRYT